MPWNFTLERWIGACREPWRPEMKYWMGAPAAPVAAEQRRDESHVRGGGQSERVCWRAGSQTRRRARTRRRRVPWPPAFLAWSTHRSAHGRLLPTKMSPGDHTCTDMCRACACARPKNVCFPQNGVASGSDTPSQYSSQGQCVSPQLLQNCPNRNSGCIRRHSVGIYCAARVYAGRARSTDSMIDCTPRAIALFLPVAVAVQLTAPPGLVSRRERTSCDLHVQTLPRL